MEQLKLLEQHGLFDAKVPRYTSYPPANHFENGVGRRNQKPWLEAVPEGSNISIYVHIPFCKRLCWFCACRTQGTKTMRPVDAYVDTLLQEIQAARMALPKSVKVMRLHLGGGTPTLLSEETMERLLTTIFDQFEPTDAFEFSVEIDPTEARTEVLDVLIRHGMSRASIGVQDFNETVQAAIGRMQTLKQTTEVIEYLRENGVSSVNLDVLYGLPHQTKRTYDATLDKVLALTPDRLAIYGYAHVPWMSKRQILIKESDLPNAQARFELTEHTARRMLGEGYTSVGIDHFALPSDSLAQAASNGTLRRNFQGYTDDTAECLVGFGASAISRFEQGYLQNAPITSAYMDRIKQDDLAAHKGYEFSMRDTLVASIIEDLMCNFEFREASLAKRFPEQSDFIRKTTVNLMHTYPDVFFINSGGLKMQEDAKQLVRIIAKSVDGFLVSQDAHSAAV